MKPIRFGARAHTRIPPKNWIKTVQHIEELGYSTIFEDDHFGTFNYDPIVLLSAAAAATKKINLGTLVFDVDYRHPAILARTAAALHLLSGGRFEFGIGAGWDQRDYDMVGIQFDKPLVRIRRLDEALTIIRNMWTQEKTSFKGRYYNLTEMVQAGELPKGEHPKIMVGGGGKQLLTVAGRHADIVGISLDLRLIRRDSPLITLADVNKRIGWVKDSARKSSRDPEEIEFQMEFPRAVITEDPEPLFEQYAKHYGESVDVIKAHPQALAGTVDEMIDKLSMIREETDISYMVFEPTKVEAFDIFANKVMPAIS
jgi:probable F420-dependent oxidoreductase